MTRQQAVNILRPAEATEAALKTAYRLAAFRFHPDHNKDGLEMMKLVNGAWALLKESLGSWTTSISEEKPLTDALQEVFDKIKHLDGLAFELCGSWLWVTGATYEHKGVLKENGLKFSRKKAAWYWHAGGYKKRGKKVFDLDEIRATWGSADLESEAALKVAMA